ncbi:hypothetical protein KAU33_11025 [Candidatus Dependentiae bacterium]|nr:hypothetical protein [Candidatus Dependentiae bacterium]
METLCFALGTIWNWTKSKNRNALIDYAKNLKVDGIEITFATKEEVYAFDITNDNRNWLKSLKYVSIHAPFNLLRGSVDEKELIKQLDIIDDIYKDINAKNVVIHPTELPEPRILNKYKFKMSTENLPPVKIFTIVKLIDVFKKYPNMGFCLDVAHAYLWSKDKTKRLLKKFGNRLTQVHLSGTYRRRDHQSLRTVTSNFMKSIETVFALDVPIIIEETIKKKSMTLLHEEVKFIRDLF